MNRVLVALPILAVLVAASWPASRAEGSAPALCDRMTPARLLENPGLASEWAEALRSGDAQAIARVRGMFDEIRGAHGCRGAAALPPPPASAAPRSAAPRLPPGHPPIGPDAGPVGPFRFEAPGVVTI